MKILKSQQGNSTLRYLKSISQNQNPKTPEEFQSNFQSNATGGLRTAPNQFGAAMSSRPVIPQQKVENPQNSSEIQTISLTDLAPEEASNLQFWLTNDPNYVRGIQSFNIDAENGTASIELAQTDNQHSIEEWTEALRNISRKPSMLKVPSLESSNLLSHVYKTDDIDPGEMKEFLEKALSHGINMRITSGKGPRENNPDSRHEIGYAIDVTPLDGEDWTSFTKRWTPEFLQWMEDNGYGVYNEPDETASKDWTGRHWHISRRGPERDYDEGVTKGWRAKLFGFAQGGTIKRGTELYQKLHKDNSVEQSEPQDWITIFEQDHGFIPESLKKRLG